MTQEVIEKFVENTTRKKACINIHFKERATVAGFFVHANDYDELKSKNLWRIVNADNIQQWLKTNSMSLTKIYSGLSIVRLTDN